MRAILLSVQPQYVEKILSGEKTSEIRKTIPKCDLPVEVYIYQTKKKWIYKVLKWLGLWQGKVVAKFTLRKYDRISYDALEDAYNECFNEWNTYDLDSACIHQDDLYVYSNGKDVYAWHISDLVIFEKPMQLSEFTHCVMPNHQYCQCCKHGHNIYPSWVETSEDLQGCTFETICTNRVKRPPQSYMFIEV